MKVLQKNKRALKDKKSNKFDLKSGKIKKTNKNKKEKSFKTKIKENKTLGKMSVDEFLNDDENFSDNDEENQSDNSSTEENVVSQLEKGSDDEQSASEEEDNIDIDEFKSHKQSLNKLKQIDPEFYKFLEENDKKLLNFNVSDSEAEDDDDDNDEEKQDAIHKPSEELEVASDEDDFVPDNETQLDERNITLQLIKKWQNDIKTDKSCHTINCITKAFHAALIRVSNEDEQVHCEYKVDGSSVFNAVIQLCVMELGPALRRYLKLPTGSKQAPHKCKKFIKVRTLLRGYFIDLLKVSFIICFNPSFKTVHPVTTQIEVNFYYYLFLGYV